MRILIAKVGGSLFDLPTLGPSLLHWIDEQPEEQIVMVAGGGDFVEAVRKYQPIHELSEVETHWLAVRTLSVSARMLATILGGWPVIEGPGDIDKSVLDCHAFLERDESEALPKSWAVTSDSIALQAGIRFGATRVVLLKSCDKDSLELVDTHFPILAEKCDFVIEFVNFRKSC